MVKGNINELSTVVTSKEIAAYQRDGHVCIRGLIDAEALLSYKPAIEEISAAWRYETRPIEKRETYGKAFLQVHNIWQKNRLCKEIVFAKRFAHAASQLLGVESVRIYHDQTLFKEPEGGHTPWHQDQTYWPLEANSTITMWLPLTEISEDVGSMCFVSGSHHKGEFGAGTISDSSHEKIQDWIDENNSPICTHGAMAVGDATFHSGFTLHSAKANPSKQTRPVLTVIYVAGGTRIMDPTPMQEFDLKLWLGGRQPGDIVGSEINPQLYP
jgi:ectoine hydroxylase-related dioxygenase (phytanoyl-CoA dioxygenase family)